MPRVRTLSVVLIATIAAVLLAPGVPRAEAADASFVLGALDTLQAHYVDPLSSPRMLNAALDRLREQFRVSPFGGAIPADADVGEAAELFSQRFDEIVSLEQGQYSATDLAYAAVSGMLLSLRDSHTGFIPPAAYQEERRRETGQAAFDGIGIQLLARDGQYYVTEVYPGNPADQAGVRPFDRVLAVNGHATRGLPEDAVTALVRGPAGTPVALTVVRAGQAGPFVLRVVRAPVRVPVVTSRMLGNGIGYAKIFEFVTGTGTVFRDDVFDLRRSGMQAMVLDLRGNPGGLVSELSNVAAALLPQSSPFMQIRTRAGREVTLQTSDPPVVPPAMPVVVLVDEDTGSAAELLAAALQEESRALVAGVRTAGAVEVGVTVGLPEGAGMAITVARVSSGNGARLEGHGVLPDDPEALTTIAMNAGRDSQLGAALQVLRAKLGAAAGMSLGRPRLAEAA